MLPTQKLQILPEKQQKTMESDVPMKKRRIMDYAFGERQRNEDKSSTLVSENISITERQVQAGTVENNLSVRLTEAGLANVRNEENIKQEMQPGSSSQLNAVNKQRRDSEGSETWLGSLDRTTVSLGGWDETTDAQRLLREQWGVEGTMNKISKMIKAGHKPVNVRTLIDMEGETTCSKKTSAALCFFSILELLQQGFIRVIVAADTNEIEDIEIEPHNPIY